MHAESHPLRGQTIPVVIRGELVAFTCEDWWDRISPRADQPDPVYGHLSLHDLVYGHLGPEDGPQLAALVCNQELGQ